MSKWLGIESAKKDGKYILGWSEERSMVFQIRWSNVYDDWTLVGSDGILAPEVTHWMPMLVGPCESQPDPLKVAAEAALAVAKYRSEIRREAFLEAAKLIQKTTPDPKPDALWLWHGGRMSIIEQLEELAENEGRGRDEK